MPALALAAVIAVTGCGAGGDRSDLVGDKERTGVTDGTITIGTHAPLTGVVSPGYRDIPAGAQAYFDYVNAAGGINGRKINYLVRDDAYNPTHTSQVIKELVQKEEVFAIVGGFGTPTHRAAVDFLNEQNVPDLFPVSGSVFWGDPGDYPRTWAWQPDYEIEGKLLGHWVKENHPNAKVGLLLQDDDMGESGRLGVERYLGDQIVSVQKYSPSNTNVLPQIAALKAAGAEVVVAFDTPSFTALSLLAALKLNYDPQWAVTTVGSNPDLIGALLAKFSDGSTGTGVLDGLVTTAYMPSPSDEGNDEWSELWQKVWDEHGEGGKLDSFRATGMAIAYTFVQALARGGDDPTRSGIEEALAGMGRPGLINPAFAAYRYDEDNHRGMTGARIRQVAGGTIKAITPTLITGNGDTPIEEDTSGGSEDVPPESGIPTAAD